MYNTYQKPGFYIPNPTGYKGPGDAYGPYPSVNFDYSPPGTGMSSYGAPFFGTSTPSYGSSFFNTGMPSYGSSQFSTGMPSYNPSTSFLNTSMPSYDTSFDFNSSFSNTSIYQPQIFNLDFNFNNNNDFNFLNLNSFSTDDDTSTTTTTTTTTTSTGDGGYNSDLFDNQALDPFWGNTDVPAPNQWGTTAPGLFGNVHGVNAINSRYVQDNMPNAWQDPSAPGNTWMFTTMSIEDVIGTM